MRIGIYGGSFDPIHNGHVKVAMDAIHDLELAKLIVIPAAVSPFKVESAPKNNYDRLLLVRAAFNGVEKVEVDDREIKKGGVSFAIDTVREIKSEHPDSEIYFVIGEDSLSGLERWKDYDELKKLCSFRAFKRTSESSSEVRRRLENGESIRDLVPEVVELMLKYPVSYNPDAALVGNVLKGLERKLGYCPCRLPKTPEFFCPCDEFKSQLKDNSFKGLCHCRLYCKI